jgi:type I restriction enzyme R subunit
VSREEAERRRGFDPEVPPADRAKNRSLFFDDLLDTKVREFNPRYAEAEGALLGQSAISTPTSTATGNSSSTCATGQVLRPRGDARARPDPDRLRRSARNDYEVTEEWAFTTATTARGRMSSF